MLRETRFYFVTTASIGTAKLKFDYKLSTIYAPPLGLTSLALALRIKIIRIECFLEHEID